MWLALKWLHCKWCKLTKPATKWRAFKRCLLSKNLGSPTANKCLWRCSSAANNHHLRLHFSKSRQLYNLDGTDRMNIEWFHSLISAGSRSDQSFERLSTALRIIAGTVFHIIHRAIFETISRTIFTSFLAHHRGDKYLRFYESFSMFCLARSRGSANIVIRLA